jgi:hypothetical protein
MKVISEQHEIESSGELAQANFGIEYSAKIARMFSEQVYSDPILANVREYTCNAWDAHKMVGKEDQPVVVHIPTSMEPHWAVRDFGPGLSQAHIMGTAENKYRGLFNTYGKSLKDDSNFLIGGFGIGCKAGFAYTKQDSAFTVTSWHGGIKNVFTCMVDSKGIPSITLMHCEPSNEETGVEISIPVKSKDITTFRERTITVCKYAKVLPTFTGDTAHIEPRNYVMEGKGWKRYSLSRWERSQLLIGGIAYPVDSKHFEGDARTVAERAFEIEVDIGAVELSLSRESLAYDTRTINYLTERFNEIAAEVTQHYQEKFSANKLSYWDKCILYSEYHGDPLIHSSNAKIKHRNKELQTSFSLNNELQLYGDEICCPSVSNLKESRYIRFHRNVHINPGHNCYFVWNDGTSPRIQPKYNRLMEMLPADAKVILYRSSSKRKAKKVWAALGGCPNVIHLNALESLFDASEEAKIKRDKDDLKRSVKSLRNSYAVGGKSFFLETTLDFATTDTVYYVWTKQWQIYETAECQGRAIHPDSVVRSLIGLKDAEVLNIWGTSTIYAIPAIFECHVDGKANFVNVLDLLKTASLPEDVLKEAAKHDPAHESVIESFDGNGHYYLSRHAPEYKNTELFKAMGVWKRPEDKKDKIQIARTRYNALASCQKALGVQVTELPVVPVKKVVDLDKYPMLKVSLPAYYNWRDEHYPIIVEYIKEQEAKHVSVQPT